MSEHVTYEQFYQWIKKAEEEAAQNPAGYKRKVGLFAWLGYIYIFLLIALTIACLAGLIAIFYFKSGTGGNALLFKVGAILAIFGWFLLSSLWVRFNPPQGLHITKEKFPTLFTELKDLQTKLNTLPVHGVILERSLNAAAVQTPRFGFLGWQKNHLILGLELLLVLSPQEARSVIAHELGHLSGNHSKFAGWIYRVRKSWIKLMHKIEENPTWNTFLIRKFFFWYVPRFDAFSFVLRRQNEYEADNVAAELTSNQIAGDALIKLNVLDDYLNETYWKDFINQADHQPTPATPAYSGLYKTLQNLDLPQDKLEAILKNQMLIETDYEDTHPALKDRLAALAIENTKLSIKNIDFTSSAAKVWFDDQFDEIVKHFDDEWWHEKQEGWQSHYHQIKNEKNELEQLSKKDEGTLSQGELWQFASLTNRYNSAEQAIPIFEAYQSKYPDDLDAAMVLGRLLAQTDNENCLTQWAKLPKDYPHYVDACDEASNFLANKERLDEAKIWKEKADARYDILKEAQTERKTVTINDELIKPNLSEIHKNYILQKLKQHKFISSAWIAQKTLKHNNDLLIYIIAYQAKLFQFNRQFQLDHERKEFDAVLESFGDCQEQPEPLSIFVTHLERFLPDQMPKKVKNMGIKIL